MGHFNLIVQHHKPTKPVHGVLSMCNDKAEFFTGNGEADSRLVGTLERVRMECAASNGILLSGMERIGNKYRLQEWWLVYHSES